VVFTQWGRSAKPRSLSVVGKAGEKRAQKKNKAKKLILQSIIFGILLYLDHII